MNLTLPTHRESSSDGVCGRGKFKKIKPFFFNMRPLMDNESFVSGRASNITAAEPSESCTIRGGDFPISSVSKTYDPEDLKFNVALVLD